DRGGSVMNASLSGPQIARGEAFPVAPRWVFVRIETAGALLGWGEASLEGYPDVLSAAGGQFAGYLEGRDAGLIEDHSQVLNTGKLYRGGPVVASAVAGVDQALWDLLGKRLGVPVHALLGGAVRDRIRAYGWVGGDDPSEVADHISAQLEVGLTAVKMNASG